MAMRLRKVNGGWIVLCAAQSKPRDEDIYIDDVQDHAIRVKLESDWREEGYMFDKCVF